MTPNFHRQNGVQISAEPKFEIDRGEVPVRIEMRLAAVLKDLDEHKRMGPSECFEETLLHPFEKVESGRVASPHTENSMDHIRAFKIKHGIDYDTHVS